MRLNFGCGPRWADHPGWVPVDREDFGQTHIADVCDGLPFDAGQFEWVAAHHVLQMVDHYRVVDALKELRRVGRVLRISVPDVDAAVTAWRNRDATWFPVLGTADVDEMFCTYLMWYSSQRVLFTKSTLANVLRTAGFRSVDFVGFKETSVDASITELDGRPHESVFCEAR